jgi:hypothetical protein
MLATGVFLLCSFTVATSQPKTWGFNYDRTSTGPSSVGGVDVTLKELFDVLGPDAALSKLSSDFQAMHALNGTSVRLFVNLPDLVLPPPYAASAPINATFLALLVSACDAAGGAGLTVDLTGSTFERQDMEGMDAWRAASDEDLLSARAAFWAAAAAALKGHPWVRNFNLVNEPFVVWDDFLHEVVTGCIPVVRPNNATSTFCYLHPVFRHATLQWTRAMHALFPTPSMLAAHWKDYPLPGETFNALAIPAPSATDSCRRKDYTSFLFNKTSEWCSTLAGAIRAADPARLVTVGIQFGSTMPDTLTAQACKDSLDFFSVHLYPRGDFPTPAALQQYFVGRLDLLPTGTSKAVTWEEFYPMGQAQNISMQEIPGILLRASSSIRAPLRVQSHFSFYWGTAESLDMSPISAAIYNQWLLLWAAARPF